MDADLFAMVGMISPKRFWGSLTACCSQLSLCTINIPSQSTILLAQIYMHLEIFKSKHTRDSLMF